MLLGYRSDDSIEHLPDEHEFVTGVCTLAACIFVDLCTCVTMYILCIKKFWPKTLYSETLNIQTLIKPNSLLSEQRIGCSITVFCQ